MRHDPPDRGFGPDHDIGDHGDQPAAKVDAARDRRAGPGRYAVAVDPRQDGTQAHVTIQVDFRGYGMGKLIMPMVVREARNEVPQSCQQLKSRLESGSGAPAEP